MHNHAHTKVVWSRINGSGELARVRQLQRLSVGMPRM
jgi:hypothetical protein